MITSQCHSGWPIFNRSSAGRGRVGSANSGQEPPSPIILIVINCRPNLISIQGTGACPSQLLTSGASHQFPGWSWSFSPLKGDNVSYTLFFSRTNICCASGQSMRLSPKSPAEERCCRSTGNDQNVSPGQEGETITVGDLWKIQSIGMFSGTSQ